MSEPVTLFILAVLLLGSSALSAIVLGSIKKNTEDVESTEGTGITKCQTSMFLHISSLAQVAAVVVSATILAMAISSRGDSYLQNFVLVLILLMTIASVIVQSRASDSMNKCSDPKNEDGLIGASLGLNLASALGATLSFIYYVV